MAQLSLWMSVVVMMSLAVWGLREGAGGGTRAEAAGAVGMAAVVNLTATEDTSIRKGFPTYNYGGSETVQISPNTSNPQHSLLRWDVSSIPATATVTAASLTFYVSDSSSQDFNLYALLRGWVEGNLYGSASSASKPGANWGYYDYEGGHPWGQAGATSTLSDRGSVDLWDATATDFGLSGSVTIPLNASGVAVVQNWIDSPASNFGLTVQYSGPAYTTHDYWIVASSEVATVAQRPTLNITYNEAASLSTAPAVLSGFQAAVGQVSAEQTYTVSGNGLGSEPLVINAPVDFEISTSTGSGFGSTLNLSPSGGVISATIYVRLAPTSSRSYEQLEITHRCGGLSATVEVNGSSIPRITTSASSLAEFISGVGEYATEQSYTVRGENLAEAILVTAPADFYVSRTSGSNYASNLSLTPTGGVVAETTIYVTFQRNTEGSSSGTIQHSAGALTGPGVTVSGLASACETVSLTAVEDTYLTASPQSYNYGGASSLEVNTGLGTGRRTALLKWDLSSLEENGSVKTGSAVIQLNVTDLSGTAYSLYAMRRSWVEGTSNGGTSSTSANWYTWDGVNPWGTYGAASIDDDRFDVNLWNATSSSFATAGIGSIDLNAAGEGVIDGWLYAPLTNYGLIIQTYADLASDNLIFSSSENSNPDLRPKLSFEYCREVNQAPNVPGLVGPADEASEQPLSVDLVVSASDNNSGNQALTVQFFGRVTGDPGDFALIGSVNVADGENASQTWSGLAYFTEYEWYTVVSDGSLSTSSPTWRFRTIADPTAVMVMGFRTEVVTNGVVVRWSTASEVGLVGFNLYRAEGEAGARLQLNPELIPARTPGDLMGAEYQYEDGTAVSGKSYSYWIEVISQEGTEWLEPVQVAVPYWLRLPLVVR